MVEKAFGKGKPYQNRKKDRKCHQSSQKLIFSKKLEKFTIFLRFFYDFGKVSLSQKLFSTTEIDFEADSYQNRKKIVKQS